MSHPADDTMSGEKATPEEKSQTRRVRIPEYYWIGLDVYCLHAARRAHEHKERDRLEQLLAEESVKDAH